MIHLHQTVFKINLLVVWLIHVNFWFINCIYLSPVTQLSPETTERAPGSTSCQMVSASVLDDALVLPAAWTPLMASCASTLGSTKASCACGAAQLQILNMATKHKTSPMQLTLLTSWHSCDQRQRTRQDIFVLGNGIHHALSAYYLIISMKDNMTLQRAIGNINGMLVFIGRRFVHKDSLQFNEMEKPNGLLMLWILVHLVLNQGHCPEELLQQCLATQIIYLLCKAWLQPLVNLPFISITFNVTWC